jgi:hypothetical protein
MTNVMKSCARSTKWRPRAQIHAEQAFQRVAGGDRERRNEGAGGGSVDEEGADKDGAPHAGTEEEEVGEGKRSIFPATT